MFKGSQSVNFKTEERKERVYEIIQQNLESLGGVDITDRGQIKINASRFSGFAHESEMYGTIRERDGRYSVELDWEAKPNWLIVILAAICLMGLGLALLILPFMANNDMQKRASSVLDNIRFDFNG